MKTAINIQAYGQRQMCRIRFSEVPTEQWLRLFLSRCDAHPTETEEYEDSVVLYRDRFRSGFGGLVESAVQCATELVELGIV